MDQTLPRSGEHIVDINPFNASNESVKSAVSWGAVAGGAAVAAALTLILLSLGAGLGLAAMSPWAGEGASAKAIGVGAIVWLIAMQIISSSFGGYVAGRLRTMWVDVHTDEVYFRDTAHGFLVWAVGLVISAGFLGSSAGSLMGFTAEAGAGAAVATAAAGTAGAAQAMSENSNQGGNASAANNDRGYFVDSLFRSNGATPATPSATAMTSQTAPSAANPATASAGNQAGTGNATDTNSGASAAMSSQMRGTSANTRAEVARIMAKDLTGSDFPAADKAYLSQLVAAQTGMSAADADRRVNAVITQAQQAKVDALQKVDDARKSTEHLAFWTFLALLIGAFCASFAATIGGRQRDSVKAALRA